MKSLKKTAAGDMKVIKKYCRDAAAHNNAEVFEWISDNYYILSGVNASAESFAKKHSGDYSPLFSACKIICTGGVLPEEERLIGKLRLLKLSVAMCGAVGLVLSVALLDTVANACREGGDGQEAVNAVKSLMRLRDIDFSEHYYEISETERILCDDPSGDYDKMSDDTKQLYREAVVSFRKNEGVLIFERITHERGISPALAVGFYSNRSFTFETDREKILQRDPYRVSPFSQVFDSLENGLTGINKAAAICLERKITAGSAEENVLVVTAGANAAEAYSRFLSVRSEKLPDVKKGAANPLAKDALIAPSAARFLSVCFGCAIMSDARRAALAENTAGREGLWQSGISGDLPVITVFPDFSGSSGVLRSFVKMHKKLSLAGIANDLAFVFEKNPDYALSNSEKLKSVLTAEDCADTLAQKGGIHIFFNNTLSSQALCSILCASSLIFPADVLESAQCSMKVFPEVTRAKPLKNGENSFTPNGYFINEMPQLPWRLTLANSSFGTLVSDISAGFSWAMNSSLNKLMPWSNDVCSDFYGEKILLKNGGTLYDVLCGASVFYSDTAAEYCSRCGEINVRTRIEVPAKGMKKRISVTLCNSSSQVQTLQLIYYCVPVLSQTHEAAGYIKYTADKNGITVFNPLNTSFSGCMKIYVQAEKAAVCADLSEIMHMSEKKSALPLVGNDCAAVGVSHELQSGEEKQAVFGMCFASRSQALDRLINAEFIPMKSYNPCFKTPLDALTVFSSSLLAHQVLSTRLYSRTGFYQNGGAYGFRDQLQDILPLIKDFPRLASQLIFRCCAAQFPEGDVLHWFHVLFNGKQLFSGVRTRCSDDMLWLPFAVSEYVSVTGDKAILSVSIPYLDGKNLEEDENERYEGFAHSRQLASVYEHCLQAVKKACRTGAHGLPLIMGGDWNDSF